MSTYSDLFSDKELETIVLAYAENASQSKLYELLTFVHHVEYISAMIHGVIKGNLEIHDGSGNEWHERYVFAKPAFHEVLDEDDLEIMAEDRDPAL